MLLRSLHRMLKDKSMARAALVSGGTRGIGAAISEALLKAGYSVAATYAGNEAAAKAFREKTGAAVYRWDAGDFEACGAGNMCRSVKARERAGSGANISSINGQKGQFGQGRLGEPQGYRSRGSISTLSINGGQYMS